MKDVFMIIDVIAKWLDVYYFINNDLGVRSLIIKIFTKFVVALMERIER